MSITWGISSCTSLIPLGCTSVMATDMSSLFMFTGTLWWRTCFIDLFKEFRLAAENRNNHMSSTVNIIKYEYLFYRRTGDQNFLVYYHNYIWCPYYLPSFMKFCSVVSEELCWQAASVVNFGKFLSSKGHNSHKIQEIKISW